MAHRNPISGRSQICRAGLLLGVCALWAAPAAAQSTNIGIASAIVGEATISTAAAPKERPIARKQGIAWGNIVSTKKRSELHILLLDRSNFTIGANTRMTIDRFVYDPNEGRSFVGRIFEGAFRFMSGQKNDRSSGTIESPVGTIGIRGTAVDGLVGINAMEIGEAEPAVGKAVVSDKKTATLVVLRGPGAATEGGLTVGLVEVTAAGTTVTLDQPGYAAYIPRLGAPPIGPFLMSRGGLSEVQDKLQPTVTRANKGDNSLLKVLGGVAAIGVAAVLLTDDDDKPGGQRPQGQEPYTPVPSGQIQQGQSVPGTPQKR